MRNGCFGNRSKCVIIGLILCLLLVVYGCEKDNPCDREDLFDYSEIPMSSLEYFLEDGETISIDETKEDLKVEKITVIGKMIETNRLAGPGKYQVSGFLHQLFELNPLKLVDPAILNEDNFVLGDIDPFLIVTGSEGKVAINLEFAVSADLDMYLFAMEDDGACGFFVNYDNEVSQAAGARDMTEPETDESGDGEESEEDTESSPMLDEKIEISNLTPQSPFLLVVEGFMPLEQNPKQKWNYTLQLDVK